MSHSCFPAEHHTDAHGALMTDSETQTAAKMHAQSTDLPAAHMQKLVSRQTSHGWQGIATAGKADKYRTIGHVSENATRTPSLGKERASNEPQ